MHIPEDKPRILIVDDNPNIHRDFELVFEAESQNQDLEAEEKIVFGSGPRRATGQCAYELDHAFSGIEAVEKVKKSLALDSNYQMAFVDIRMPGIDGVETILRIWKLDPAIQIVICTAFADYSQEDLTTRLGQTDKLIVLKKPFDTIEVTQLAGTLTAKWSLARQAALKLEQMELLVARRTEKVLDLQRREAQRIHELDQMKLQFLNNFVHEIRAPLTLLVAGVDQLLRTEKLTDQHQETFRTNADRLLNLVNRLANLHSLNAEDLKPELSPADVILLLRGVVGFFQPTASQQQVVLQFHAAEDSGCVYFDAGKLEKALFLILSNALQSIPAAGSITVTADFSDSVNIVIKISGGHIPDVQEVQPVLWLTLARRLVEVQSGTLALENFAGRSPQPSEPSNHCFIITLPLKKAPDGIEVTMPVPFAKLEHTTNLRASDAIDHEIADKAELPTVLIIEADQELRRHIRQSLEAEYQITQASDGQEGFKLAQETMPDLIITDVMVAWTDRVAFCSKLKSDDLTSHIPVVLLANYGDDQRQVEALEAGADEFITKPFRMPLLRVRVANLLISRRRMLERLDPSAKLIPRDSATNQVDSQFMRRTIMIVEKNLSDFEFDVDALARDLSVSRRQLFRKIKAVTNSTPNKLIRSVRLNRAAQLLKESCLTVSEITYAVGFSDLKHFREVFREQFGVLPGDYPTQA